MYSFIKNISFQQILFCTIISTGIVIIGFILNSSGALTISGVFVTLTGLTGFLVGLSASHLKKTPIQLQNSSELGNNVLFPELENLKKENIKINAELLFFKNQFNSHILFNFLNFCYSKIHKSSESAAEAIESFSEMLRYSSQMKIDEPVSLKKEIEYIENYIVIQKCLTEKVCVSFKHEGDISKKKILPGLLVTFVENAFKYGEIHNEKHPIEIMLMVVEERIVFNMKNRKNIAQRIDTLDSKHQSPKQMLDFFYEKRYTLKTKDKGDEYWLYLELK